MPDRRDRAGRGRGQRNEVAARRLDLVAVAHPDDRLARDVVEERLGRVEHAAFRAAELAAGRVGLRPGTPSASQASCIP